jgi:hypothetical protein
MSNRNFDASSIIQRLQNKNKAQSLYNAQKAGAHLISNPQNSDPSPQVISDFKEGVETTYTKNLGIGYTVDIGGIANLPV